MSSRRDFLAGSGLLLPALSAGRWPAPLEPAPAPIHELKLGVVTYNIAKDWDVPTIIKHCTEAKFQGVELRTTHAHGVEVKLTKAERIEVRKRFADSPVELMGLGSGFDYHTPVRPVESVRTRWP